MKIPECLKQLPVAMLLCALSLYMQPVFSQNSADRSTGKSASKAAVKQDKDVNTPAKQSKQAQAPQSAAGIQDPWQLVDEFARKALASARGNAKKPEVFSRDINRLLGELVDFDVFSRRVMGDHASDQKLHSLPPDQQKKLRVLIGDFSTIFRQALVDAYSNAFLLAAGQVKIVTEPLKKPADKTKSTVVRQSLVGFSDQAVPILYQMEYRNKHWTLRNISVAGINLGKLYRNQFANAVATNKGNLELTIKSWHANEEEQ